jgi:hypothetical protein
MVRAFASRVSGSQPRLTPPVPPSAQRLPSGEVRFFHDLVDDLAVRVEWLHQVIDGVPEPQASSSALVQLRGWARALNELHVAIGHVQANLDDRQFARLFALDGPLAAFLSRLYAWCEEISGDFERLAAKIRRKEPVLAVFSHRVVSESYAHFQKLGEALRSSLADSRPMTAEAQAVWKTFDADFEELLWATEWLHMSLANGPTSS